jgi:hypothetical protein
VPDLAVPGLDALELGSAALGDYLAVQGLGPEERVLERALLLVEETGLLLTGLVFLLAEETGLVFLLLENVAFLQLESVEHV